MIFLEFVLLVICIQTCLSGKVLRYYENGTSVECQSIKCSYNENFVPCTDPSADGKQDICRPCPTDKPRTSDVVDSLYFSDPPPVCTSETDKCFCEEDAELINPVECHSTLRPKCQCNVTAGYYGLDPKLCSPSDDELCKQPGFELNLNGSCNKCPEGSYKNHDGFGRCLQQPRCEEPYVVDCPGDFKTIRTCKVPPTSQASKSTIPPTAGIPNTPVIPTAVMNETNQTTPGQLEETNIGKWATAVGVPVGVITFILLVCCIVRCRRRTSQTNSDLRSDEENVNPLLQQQVNSQHKSPCLLKKIKETICKGTHLGPKDKVVKNNTEICTSSDKEEMVELAQKWNHTYAHNDVSANISATDDLETGSIMSRLIPQNTSAADLNGDDMDGCLGARPQPEGAENIPTNHQSDNSDETFVKKSHDGRQSRMEKNDGARKGSDETVPKSRSDDADDKTALDPASILSSSHDGTLGEDNIYLLRWNPQNNTLPGHIEASGSSSGHCFRSPPIANITQGILLLKGFNMQEGGRFMLVSSNGNSRIESFVDIQIEKATNELDLPSLLQSGCSIVDFSSFEIVQNRPENPPSVSCHNSLDQPDQMLLLHESNQSDSGICDNTASRNACSDLSIEHLLVNSLENERHIVDSNLNN